ncbi:unnamed protein product [Rhizopus microsporus]
MTSINSKFRALSEITADCQQHIERLSHVNSLTVQREISDLIKSDLRSLEEKIASIKLLAEEDDNQDLILKRLSEYENQLRHLQANSRQAMLTSKRQIINMEKRNREELFGRTVNESSFSEQFELKQRGIQKSHHDHELLRASSDVTEALRRTSTLMQQELEKSTLSATMLAESSRTLSNTYSEYQNLGALVNISKRVITQLEASDWFDRILLSIGLFFFCFVVLYIIKKRTWDVGISWISWLTRSTRSTINSDNSQFSPVVTMIPTMVAREEL